jgi:hypothetical protein
LQPNCSKNGKSELATVGQNSNKEASQNKSSCFYTEEEVKDTSSSSSSLLARQPLVGSGLLKKLCPFVEGDLLPILDL